MPGGGGSPQTFSQGGNPATYVPTAQPQMDQLFQQTIGNFPTNPSQTPAGQAYPQAQSIYSLYLDPTQNFGAGYGAQAQQGAELGRTLGQAAAPQLANAGNQILQTGFDPQNELFNRTRGQVIDQAAVANSMAGLGGTPYGASNISNAGSNFDINWQNNLLNRQTTAAGAAAPLLSGAPGLAATSGALPYTAGQGIAQTGIQGLGATANLGNQAYALPQQVLNDLESYLQLGQAASSGAIAGGNTGFQQTAQGLGGLLSGANTLFGGGGAGGSGGLLSGIFGGGGGSGGLGSAASTFGALPAASQDAFLASPGVFDAIPAAAFDTAATAAPAAAATGGGGFLSSLLPVAAS
jgi:hypothetical protein